MGGREDEERNPEMGRGEYLFDDDLIGRSARWHRARLRLVVCEDYEEEVDLKINSIDGNENEKNLRLSCGRSLAVLSTARSGTV